MSKERLERARKLLAKYELTSEDWFKHQGQGWVIITLPGCEKIAAKESIELSFEDRVLTENYAVIKAIARKDGKKVETYGSAKLGGFGKGTTQSHYIAEIAEKRALVRAVLKMENLYSEGVYSEEEAEDFKDDRIELTSQVINRANNAITRGDQTAEEVIEALEEKGYVVGETMKYAWKKIKQQTKAEEDTP